MGELFGGGGSKQTTTTTTTSTNTTNVTTNTGVQVQNNNNIDLTPIQKLVDTLSGVNSAAIGALTQQSAETAAAVGLVAAQLAKPPPQAASAGPDFGLIGGLLSVLAALIAAGYFGKKKGWL